MEESELQNVWSDEERIVFPPESLQLLALTPQDRDVLLGFGLPEFAAPNLYFHAPEPLGDPGIVKIGEDRDDNPIVLRTARSGVWVRQPTGQLEYLFMNSSIISMINTLAEYQLMVDAAIEASGRRAFIDNDIPVSLVDRFFRRLELLDKESPAGDTFWRREVARLRSDQPA